MFVGEESTDAATKRRKIVRNPAGIIKPEVSEAPPKKEKASPEAEASKKEKATPEASKEKSKVPQSGSPIGKRKKKI